MHQIASKLRLRLPPQIDFDDLEAAGRLGLAHAAARFDPARGISFGAFARRRVLGAMIDHLRSTDMLSRDDRKRHRDGGLPFFVLQLRLIDETDDGIAEPASVEPTPAEWLQRTHVCRQVQRAIGRLPHRERYVIRQHFYRGRALRAIGLDLGVGEARTSQLKQRALERLRYWLAS